MQWHDHKTRCSWANPLNPAYLEYHDREWGKPVHDDNKLFELLTLEMFQSGLSWECVLNKRENFRHAFANFNPKDVAAFTDPQIQQLMKNTGIIRNRSKISAAIQNARSFLHIQQQCGSFDHYLWNWSKGNVIREQNQNQSELSRQLAADLKRQGMLMLGPVTVYSYLQAVGVIYGHEPGCFLENSIQPVEQKTLIH